MPRNALSYSKKSIWLGLLLLATPLSSFAKSCRDVLALPEASFSKMTSLKDVHSKSELDQLIASSNQYLQDGMKALQAMDPAFNNEVLVLQEKGMDVQISSPPNNQTYSVKYLALLIIPEKISPTAQSDVATHLRRVGRMHPDTRINIDPIENKSMSSEGAFDGAVKDVLAIFLNENFLRNLTFDFPFDIAEGHELRHLLFEANRRKGGPANVFDYRLKAGGNAKVSHAGKGYANEYSFEEYYAWSSELLTTAKQLKHPAPHQNVSVLMKSFRESMDRLNNFVLDHPDNVLFRISNELENAIAGRVSVNEFKVKSAGKNKDNEIKLIYKSYTVWNLHPKVVAQFKNKLHTDAGKKEALIYFLNDFKKLEASLADAREQLKKVRSEYFELRNFNGSEQDRSELSLLLLQETQKLYRIFRKQLP